MSLLHGSGRGRAFLRFLLGVAWLIVAYYLSTIAAHGFSRGAAFPLIRNLFAIFVLIVGYAYMEMAWDDNRAPLKAMGLATRNGAAREFALGAALGWGMVTAVMLVVALAGTFYVELRTSAHAWETLEWETLATATAALAGEIAFRGYPFQQLIKATGPFIATILAGIFFGLLRLETPGATPAAVWISAMAAVLLSVAYLRTYALWICWGLHFAWVAGIGIVFGQPLAGSRQVSSVIHTYVDGPTWLTGAEFGPEASLVTLIVLWLGFYVLIRMTRDLAWKYSQPELKSAGIPVDLSHPMHPAPPPPAASALDAPRTGLVQIVPLGVVAGPAPLPGSKEQATPTSSTESFDPEVQRKLEDSRTPQGGSPEGG